MVGLKFISKKLPKHLIEFNYIKKIINKDIGLL